MKFKVTVEGPVRGYVCENYGAPFRLPELGPIGSQGLAQPRDFQVPVAAFEDKGKSEVIAKFMGGLWASEFQHSPLDVVAWHGDYVPYKYDLARFMGCNHGHTESRSHHRHHRAARRLPRRGPARQGLYRPQQNSQPDELYNLGAQSHVAVSFEEPQYTANSDALGGKSGAFPGRLTYSRYGCYTFNVAASFFCESRLISPSMPSCFTMLSNSVRYVSTRLIPSTLTS
jgi:hypothetical protein